VIDLNPELLNLGILLSAICLGRLCAESASQHTPSPHFNCLYSAPSRPASADMLFGSLSSSPTHPLVPYVASTTATAPVPPSHALAGLANTQPCSVGQRCQTPSVCRAGVWLVSTYCLPDYISINARLAAVEDMLDNSARVGHGRLQASAGAGASAHNAGYAAVSRLTAPLRHARIARRTCRALRLIVYDG
jgi:hypothetical protein